ncbi:MAG TPA: DUF2197 domain-containing protein [Syntrophomonadaceae bacterium]|nr:DUF2197 domain-containing protein [Syntrophomonadaceae bacterium]
MQAVPARCLLCGKSYDVPEDHKEFKKLIEQGKPEANFICDLCNNRVRHEADEQRKPQKPKSN